MEEKKKIGKASNVSDSYGCGGMQVLEISFLVICYGDDELKYILIVTDEQSARDALIPYISVMDPWAT